jgi:hypothetical protein
VSVRWLRSPAVLMTAYVGLFLYAGPWAGPVGSAHRNWGQVLVAVCLAYLACRGRRAARVLMIAYSMVGVLIMLFGSTSSWQPDPAAVRLGPFACYLAQVCLLVSAPMYERTRPSWSPARFPSSRFLPAPRVWTVPASLAAGLIITLLPIYNLRGLACPAGHSAAPAGPCLAQGTGYPIAYHFDGGIVRLPGGNIQWLDVLAPRGLEVIAFAADWAMWSLSVALILYLLSLEVRRQHDPSGPRRVASSPAPAG